MIPYLIGLGLAGLGIGVPVTFAVLGAYAIARTLRAQTADHARDQHGEWLGIGGAAFIHDAQEKY